MLSLETARALKAAGLTWQPREFDFFHIPDRELDERVFVINQMPAALAQMQGQPVFVFEGAVEWALDYVAAGEVVWLPTEAQLRELLAERLEADTRLRLLVTPAACRCELQARGEKLVFEAADGAEAYGRALLHLLQTSA
jgi:hypothetical protein